MDLPTVSSSPHSFSVSPVLTLFLFWIVLRCLVGFPGIFVSPQRVFSQQKVVFALMREEERMAKRKSDWLIRFDQSSPALVVGYQSQVLGREYKAYSDCSFRNEEERLSTDEKDM